jgi:hypothetical protein
MADRAGESLTIVVVAGYLHAGRQTADRLERLGDIPALSIWGLWFRRPEQDRRTAARLA